MPDFLSLPTYKGNDDEIALLPNSSYWTENYSNSDVDYIYLHCPYLCNPWQITRFGKKIGKGDFETGDV